MNISVIFIIILMTFSTAKGRVLFEAKTPSKADSPSSEPEEINYNGNFTLVNLIISKNVKAYFPSFGNKCSIDISVYGLNFESPYLEGNMNLTIYRNLASEKLSPKQQLDALKDSLCNIMKVGATLSEFSSLGKTLYFLHQDDNGSILIVAPALSVIGGSFGSIDFYDCSCE